MKRIPFKIRLRNDGVDYLQEVLAEKYDELVYYVSPRINKDFKFNYSFYDKKTGLSICTGKNKQELIDTYNKVYEKYADVRESKYYQKYIDQYEYLKKEVN